MDEDDDRRCEVEMEVIGKVPRPAVALERERRLLLSAIYQVCLPPSVRLPGPGEEFSRQVGISMEKRGIVSYRNLTYLISSNLCNKPVW